MKSFKLQSGLIALSKYPIAFCESCKIMSASLWMLFVKTSTKNGQKTQFSWVFHWKKMVGDHISSGCGLTTIQYMTWTRISF